MSTPETSTREPSPDSRRSPDGPAVLESDDLAQYPAPPRRRALRWAAGVMALAVLAGAGWWAAGHPGLDTATRAASGRT